MPATRDIKVSRSKNTTININCPQHSEDRRQYELDLQTKEASVSVRFFPYEKIILEEIAKQNNKALSDLVRTIVIKWIKSEEQLIQLYQTLDEMFNGTLRDIKL